ncbi:hypothetical protein CONCODRAFT_9328 [Conidiobolus coronatus NRRL 28638]|uniref:Uncharacterized protein n=1 Tax=Conidiobolus coronatus (strain ATCC 28846 / CBS 209.66 / NRRL 28638) TaxID=796925 RepID=A0A137P068_CONC2|nr:hypothetical protein CONCODRAFT_9328 [Conidiobolus coronatus NRRL 28638]|eukprot:KXN68436.1 hypothetical protein CONCODRAFT_9328 [Conidiobolus coronatus NRRL 28638]
MLGYLIGAGVGFVIIVLICIWKFGFRKTSGESDEERNHVRMHAYDGNLIFTNLGSNQAVNNNPYPEQDDPASHRLLPADSAHVQIPIPSSELNQVQAQIPIVPQEHIDRPPTYNN